MSGKCHAACNTRDCGFQGCSTQQAAQACRNIMDAEQGYYLQPPHVAGGSDDFLVGVDIRPRVPNPITIAIAKDFESLIIVSIPLKVTAWWSDPRPAASECGPVLDHMISTDCPWSTNHEELLFVPRVQFQHLGEHLQDIVRRNLGIDYVSCGFEILNHSRPIPGLVAGVCTDCNQYTEDITLTFSIFGDFYYFPFDTSTAFLEWTTSPGAQLAGCDSLASHLRELAVDGELMSGQQWIISGDDISTEQPSPSRCRVTMLLSRNYVKGLLGELLTLMLIVQAALLSLRLDPLAPPLVGARCSIQIFAMVLISVRLSTDRGKKLGVAGDALWIDWFYSAHFFFCILGVAESVAVHTLIRQGRKPLAMQFDDAFKWVVPFFIYPVFIIALLIDGAVLQHGPCVKGNCEEKTQISILIAVVCVACVFFLFMARAIHRHTQLLALQKSLAQQMMEASDEELTDENAQHSPIMLAAFKAFDTDRSNGISGAELRNLVKLMYPGQSLKWYKEALQFIPDRKKDASVPFEQFDDIVRAWRQMDHANDGQADYKEGQPGSTRTSLSTGILAILQMGRIQGSKVQHTCRSQAGDARL